MILNLTEGKALMRYLTTIACAVFCLLAVLALSAVADARKRGHVASADGRAARVLTDGRAARALADGRAAPAPAGFEQVVFVDPPEEFHGGPPPHTATDAATDFKLAQGGSRWFGAPKTVKYSVSDTGCSNDCGGAVGQVNAGLDAWQVSTLTFTQDNASPDPNPCTPGSGNSVSWTSIDGPDRTLAVAAACRNVATKEIVGFRIFFDSGDTWSDSGDSGKFDIRATGAHEGGHVAGPDHVHPPRDSRLTMFPFLLTGDIGPRTLGCGDRLGVNALYGTSLACTGLPGD